MSLTSPTPQPEETLKNTPPTKARRWYDHDPLLMEVLEIMRSFQEDVKVQAEVFLEKLVATVGAEAMEQFYLQARPVKFGQRWYDQDASISKAVELLRVLPPAKQRETAQKFLEALKRQGLSSEMLQELQVQQTAKV
jgi:hypothetical protein